MKMIMCVLLVLGCLSFGPTIAKADGCYMCSGGSYVKYSGDDDQDKRKAAKACGCEITGTRGSCDAANLKILCTVLRPYVPKWFLACVM